MIGDTDKRPVLFVDADILVVPGWFRVKLADPALSQMSFALTRTFVLHLIQRGDGFSYWPLLTKKDVSFCTFTLLPSVKEIAEHVQAYARFAAASADRPAIFGVSKEQGFFPPDISVDPVADYAEFLQRLHQIVRGVY